ncbi:phosphotransferase [Candidatus Woesearchaeota archaeon]|nr:phosphotransferase [Candidatus Woesearchaeota archaeon]
MNEEIVNNICIQTFNVLPDSIQRNHVGIAAYVYTIVVKGNKYVLKISEVKDFISGSIYWLNKLQDYELPIPRIISQNIAISPYHFIMTYIPGKDLGYVYNTLSAQQKQAISYDLFKCQNLLKTLPVAKGFGWLNSYEDVNNMKKNWREVVESNIERSEQRIRDNRIFSIDYVNRVKSIIPFFNDYFATIKPEPFFDDTTTKNVLVHQGKLSGIIDLDWICFGDRLYVIALTTMALLSIQTDLEYVEFWKSFERLSDIQEEVFIFYILVFV